MAASAAAAASAILLAACGSSGHARGSGAGGGTSIAAALIAFVAPRDGADAVIGGQLASFVQTVQSKELSDCITTDGFPAPQLPTGGTPNDLGNPQFPNLPQIEATHNIGLYTGGGGASSFFGAQAGMSRPERRAWQARLMHCFQTMNRHALLFSSAKFGQLNSAWYSIVNQVSQTKQIRTLSKAAATCSTAHGLAATSVMSVYERLQNQVGPISSSSTDSAKDQALQAKGATVLGACWTKVINETTALLSSRRTEYLAQYAQALSALESQVNGEVASVERRYGIKPTLEGS